jgi:hypothetical protein
MFGGIETKLLQNIILQRPKLIVASLFFRVVLVNGDIHD